MSYEYTDRDGSKLRITLGPAGHAVYVETEESYEGQPVRIQPQDAPAVALAILEAAGLGIAGVDNLTSAMADIRSYAAEVEELRAEQAGA